MNVSLLSDSDNELRYGGDTHAYDDESDNESDLTSKETTIVIIIAGIFILGLILVCVCCIKNKMCNRSENYDKLEFPL
jgi:hypothetical protein